MNLSTRAKAFIGYFQTLPVSDQQAVVGFVQVQQQERLSATRKYLDTRRQELLSEACNDCQEVELVHCEDPVGCKGPWTPGQGS